MAIGPFQLLMILAMLAVMALVVAAPIVIVLLVVKSGKEKQQGLEPGTIEARQDDRWGNR
jgi:hypothetical protein